jgi:hypothetical protein
LVIDCIKLFVKWYGSQIDGFFEGAVQGNVIEVVEGVDIPEGDPENEFVESAIAVDRSFFHIEKRL